MKKGILLTIAMVVALVSAQAQAKFGFTNSGAILSQMPEVKSAETDIETFGKQLQKQGQTMVEALQNKYQDLAKREKAGELSPKQLNDEQTRLKTDEEAIGKFEQDMQTKVLEKRELKLQPILDKVNKAIADVAKENGYSYIFDASNSAVILYADESTDVTKLVKTKLGIVDSAVPGK
jgi:outer membrane protein